MPSSDRLTEVMPAPSSRVRMPSSSALVISTISFLTAIETFWAPPMVTKLAEPASTLMSQPRPLVAPKLNPLTLSLNQYTELYNSLIGFSILFRKTISEAVLSDEDDVVSACQSQARLVPVESVVNGGAD